MSLAEQQKLARKLFRELYQWFQDFNQTNMPLAEGLDSDNYVLVHSCFQEFCTQYFRLSDDQRAALRKAVQTQVKEDQADARTATATTQSS